MTKRKTKEDLEREEIMSVALAQPHRHGNRDEKLSTPLGQFCAHFRLREECHQAGEEYADRIREDRLGRGLRPLGWSPGEDSPEVLDEAQATARRDLAAFRRKEAESALRTIDRQLPLLMESLCYDQIYPHPASFGLLRRGLYDLAVEFGMIKHGIGNENSRLDISRRP